jgi:hypothetical protein
MRVICLSHLIALNLITLIIFGEEYKLRNFSLCNEEGQEDGTEKGIISKMRNTNREEMNTKGEMKNRREGRRR